MLGNIDHVMAATGEVGRTTEGGGGWPCPSREKARGDAVL